MTICCIAYKDCSTQAEFKGAGQVEEGGCYLAKFVKYQAKELKLDILMPEIQSIKELQIQGFPRMIFFSGDVFCKKSDT